MHVPNPSPEQKELEHQCREQPGSQVFANGYIQEQKMYTVKMLI